MNILHMACKGMDISCILISTSSYKHMRHHLVGMSLFTDLASNMCSFPHPIGMHYYQLYALPLINLIPVSQKPFALRSSHPCQ